MTRSRCRPPGRALSPVRVTAALALVVWLFVAALGSPPGNGAAAAAVPNAAAVVIEDGSGVKTFCVRFSADSISGLEALAATGTEVLTRAFGGMGAAVCRVGGTGCASGTDCLTCQAPNFWAYARAKPGTGSFVNAPVGASNTRVTHGSVEGWKWGTGAAPSFRSFESVCPDFGGSGGSPAGGNTAGSAPVGSSGSGTAAGAATAPAQGGSPSGAAASAPGSTEGGDASAPGPATPGAEAASGEGTGSPEPGVAGATVFGSAGAEQGIEAGAASFAEDESGGTGSSVVGWIAFALAAAALVTAVVVVRVRRAG